MSVARTALTSLCVCLRVALATPATREAFGVEQSHPMLLARLEQAHAARQRDVVVDSGTLEKR